ncbi:MAG: hypothetical protein IKG72_01950 [Bacillus sp. (in: Bacteria)]|nr:hypothetical protein [Bacillus sp. (in: firmicutes)]
MGLTERHWFENEDVPENYEWALEDAVYNSRTNKKADMVKVVRCKDCKHLFDGEHLENCCDVLMKKGGWLKEIPVSPNWFCADGERR